MQVRAAEKPRRLSFSSFSSDLYGFTVDFPSTPQEADIDRETRGPDGPSLIKGRLFLCPVGSGTFSVLAVSVPAFLRQPGTEMKVLEAGRDGVLRRFKTARLVSEGRISLGRHPGLAYTVDQEDHGIPTRLTSRSYLVNTRTVTLQVVTAPSRPPDADVQRFFASLRVLD